MHSVIRRSFAALPLERSVGQSCLFRPIVPLSRLRGSLLSHGQQFTTELLPPSLSLFPSRYLRSSWLETEKSAFNRDRTTAVRLQAITWRGNDRTMPSHPFHGDQNSHSVSTCRTWRNETRARLLFTPQKRRYLTRAADMQSFVLA